MSDVVTKVGFEVDASSVGKVKSAAASVQAELQKIGKSDAFAGLVQDFKEVAAQIQNDEFALKSLQDELVKLNATDDEIAQATAAFLSQSEAIDQVADSATKLAAAEARVSEEASTAAQSLANPSSPNTALQNFQQTQREVSPLAGGVSALRTVGRVAGSAGASGVAGAANAAAEVLELGKALKVLPDSLKAAAEGFGLLSTASDTAKTAQAAIAAAEGASAAAAGTAAAAEGVQAAAAGGVAVTAGGAAAGLAAMLIPLLPIAAVALAVAAGVALVAAALGDARQKSQEAADALKERYAAEDKVDALVRSGATIEEAYKQRADLEKQVEDATRRSNEAQSEKDALYQNDINTRGSVLAGLSAGNVVYKEFDERVTSTKKSAKDAATQLAELNKQIDGGAFAAATAKEKAEKDAADKEKADQQAAQAQEKAAREAESAAAKQQQAQEKASREAEAQAEKLKTAQDQITKNNQTYANKQVDLATSAAQKEAEITLAAQDKDEDALQKYHDDLLSIGLKARRDDIAARQKQADSEIDAAIKQGRTLEDIEADVAKNQRDSLEDRNFLAATQAEEAGQEAFNKAAITAKREEEDTARAAEREARDRQIKLTEAEQDRLNAYTIEDRNATTAYQRQLRNAKINEDQQAQQALLAHQREQAELSAHYAEIAGIRAAGYAAEKAAIQGAAPDTSGLRSTSTSTTSSTTINDNRSLGITGSFGGALTVEQLQRLALSTFQKVSY